MTKLLMAVATAAAAFVFAPAALAQAGFTLGGGAQAGVGHVALVSNTGNTSATDDASWVSLAVPSGLTLSGITHLSTEFNVTDDDCGGGSPRFEIQIGSNNMFVYLGPSPSYTGCAQNTWTASGNLVGTADACRVDTSKFPGGKVCSTWAEAVALLGSQTISAIRLMVDSGWFFAPPKDQEQTVHVRNIRLNSTTVITPQEPKKDNPAQLCKAQRASLGTAAFNELWGTNANDRNAYGKCVSAMAKARNGQATQGAIMAAVSACKERGLKGAALGACVSARDGVSATTADPAGGKKGKKGGRP